MSLANTVNTDIASAMKAREAVRLSALRMLKAAIMNKGVEKGRDLDDAEVLARIKLAHALMMFSRGVPTLYYGDEQGFAGAGGAPRSRPSEGSSCWRSSVMSPGLNWKR